MISGRTTTSLRFFGRYQDLDEETQSDLLVAKTNGLEIRLECDNTDFPGIPHVVRVGVAGSDEDAQVWAMFGQPFTR